MGPGWTPCHGHPEAGTCRARSERSWDLETAPSHVGLHKNESTDVQLGHRCGTQNPMQVDTQIPTRAQNREDIFILTKDTHMKTDTGHPDTCAHKSHTYHEQCSQGRAWTIHRCIHWQQDTYMQTRGAGVQKECGDIQGKTGCTHRLHKDSRNGYTERGAHGEVQRDIPLHSHVDRCRCTNGFT